MHTNQFSNHLSVTESVRWEEGKRLGRGNKPETEALGTGVVEDAEVHYELDDPHGRYMVLPLVEILHSIQEPHTQCVRMAGANRATGQL